MSLVRVALLNSYANAASRLLLDVPADMDVATLRRHVLQHHHVDLTAAKLIYHGHVLHDTQKLAAVFTNTASDVVHTILVWTPPTTDTTTTTTTETATTTTTTEAVSSSSSSISGGGGGGASSAAAAMSATDYWLWHTQMNMATEFQFGYDADAFANALAHAHAHIEALRRAAAGLQSPPVAPTTPPPPLQPQQQQQQPHPARVHVPAAEAAAAAQGGAAGGEARGWALLDVRLALKLVFVVLLFGQNGDSTRLFTLIAVAVGVYLYQVGAFQMDGQRQDRHRGGGGDGRAQPREAAEQRPVAAATTTTAVRTRTGPLVAVEKFIVGLFASLHPGWQPAPPQPQPPQ